MKKNYIEKTIKKIEKVLDNNPELDRYDAETIIKNLKKLKNPGKNKFTLFYGQVWAMRGNATKDVKKFKKPLWKLLKPFIKNNISISGYIEFKHRQMDMPVYVADGRYGIYQN